MLSSLVSVHDKFQFEISLLLNQGKKAQSEKYDVETYFFIPNSLDINESTYAKEDMYKSIQNHIRLKAPTVFDGDDESAIKNFTNFLDTELAKLLGKPTTQGLSELEKRLKLFICSFESAIKKRVQTLRQDKKVDLINHKVKELCTQVHEVRTKFRSYRESYEQACSSLGKVSVFDNFDEYFSYIIRRYLLRCMKITQIDEPCLREIIKSENTYCVEKKYLLPHMNNSNEEYVYRNRALLKKSIWSVLHIDVDRKGQGEFYMQIIFSIAAGISMIFATLIAFFFQSKYGNLSLPFFMALVLSYMGKDRIKEILRVVFAQKIDAFIYDKKTTIRSLEGERFGSLLERFDYQTHEKVPVSIQRTRAGQTIERLGPAKPKEVILRHRKVVNFKVKKFSKIYSSLEADGIKDVTRFNIMPFLYKMDNPNTQVMILNSENEVDQVKSLRVYHINLVVRLKTKGKDILEKYRIVLNRKGILRIDSFRE